MQKLIHWWDRYVLKFGILFLLIFIPLFPKIPLLPELFDLKHTWQYIRLDDVAVALLSGVFIIETIRRRTNVKSPLTIPIFLYWVVGAVSAIHSLMYLVGTVPNLFSHLVVFYYLRRIEYMIVFFIAFTSIRTKKDVQHYLIAFLIAFGAVTLYGFGQKLYPAVFPAFPTSNEEFAKGVPIVLDRGARIIATFAGHYDLAAYLVFTLALIGSFFLGWGDRMKKISMSILGIGGLTLLMFTKSRVSFAALVAALAVLLILNRKKWLIVPLFLAGIIAIFFAGGLSDRFGQTVRIEPVVYELPQERPLATLKEFTRPPESFGAEVTPTPYEELPLGSGFLDSPFLERYEEPYTRELINYSEATSSAVPLPEPQTYLIKQTIVYDISLTTRIQGQWPRAFEALRRNMLFGSGYSALGAATDGNYFRLLGESGIIGTLSFVSICIIFFLAAYRYLLRETDPLFRSVIIGTCAGLTGLMVNALFIDIFEASKMAYILWLTLGVSVAIIVMRTKNVSLPFKELWATLRSTPVAILTMLFVSVVLFYSVLTHHFSGDDFTWLRWAVNTSMADIPRFFVDSDEFFYRPLTKTVFYVLYQVFGTSQPALYHFVGLVFHVISSLLVYLTVKLISQKRAIAFISSLLFLIHPVHAENVFWVSGLSSVMSGCLYLASIYDMFMFDRTKKWYRWVWFVFSLLAFGLALSSYEMSMTLPGILFLYYVLKREYQRTGKLMSRLQSFISHTILPVLPHTFVLLIYLYIRNSVADSYWMQGDYDVNVVKLPFNFIGNSIGYMGELLFGFSAIPWYDALRMSLRNNIVGALIVGFGGIVLFGFLARRFLKSKKNISNDIFLYAGWFFIALIPALGLGNIAERYLYIPSVGGVALIAGIAYRLWHRDGVSKVAVSALMVLLVYWYGVQLLHAKQTWRQSGEEAHAIITQVASRHESFPSHSTLYFVNLPLRVERAWIFPVGLTDAIWLLYQDETITTETGLDLRTAMNVAGTKPDSYLFLYSNGTILEVPVYE
ncbi:O-antigen ligase family protein [Candidatus Roizmanbacteria bacterium]|nr:O-antigen ligase family protein [Candidatus Roizmanbacteria bacterium]